MRDDLDPSLMEGAAGQSATSSRFPALRCLGIGTKIETYLCKDMERGEREVVRKFFHEDFSRDNPDLVDLQLTGLAGLDHPNLALVHEFGWENDKVYLNYEYIPGMPLIEALNGAPPEQAFSLLGQLLVALDYLLAHNILHLDLKPKNCLVIRDPVTQEMQLKLVDYGLSAILHPPNRREMDAVGTPPYTAPEYALRRYPDSRSDLYSVGIYLYYALTGKLPYEGRETVKVLQAQLKSDAPEVKSPLQSVVPKTAEVVKTLLARDPQSRYPNPRAALVALMQALGNSFPTVKISWPPLFSNPDEVFFYNEHLKLFRKIILQGGRWVIQGLPGSGKSFLARWLERLFWLNQKTVHRFRGEDIALLAGEHSLNPGEPTFLIIDDADQGPVEPWLQVRPYQHVVVFGQDLPWAKKEKRWNSFAIQALDASHLTEIFKKDFGPVEDAVIQNFLKKTWGQPQAVVQQGRALARQGMIRQFGMSLKLDSEKYLLTSKSTQVETLGHPHENLPENARRLSFLLALSQVPLKSELLSSWLKLPLENLRESFEVLLHEGQIHRKVCFGEEYYQTECPLPSAPDPHISPAEVSSWIEGLYQEAWFEAGHQALLQYFSPTALKESALTLLQARFLNVLGHHFEVLKLINVALVDAMKDPQKAVAYEILGKSLLETGRLKQAEASFQRAHNLFRSLQDREGLVRSLLNLGDLFQKMEESQRALTFFQQALNEAEQAPESPALRGKVEWKVGYFYETATDFENAASRYEASLQHLIGLGPTLDLAQAYYQLAGMTFQLGDASRAEALAREALRIAIFKKAFGLQGHIFLLLSRMADPTSPTHVPFERLGEAVFVLEKIPPSTSYVKALLERAAYFEGNRQLPLAQQDAEKALHVANQLKDQDLEGQAHLIFGKILIRDFLKLPEAQKHFETAQKKFSGTGNFKLGAECAFERGEIERLREDPGAAKPHYQQSLHFLQQALGQTAPGTKEAMQLEMKKQQVELVLRSLG